MIEFIVWMANRPGMLASLAEAVGRAGVNIEALTAVGLDGEGVIRIIPDDAAAARRALSEAGLSFEERQVLSTTLPNQPGELGRLCRSLATAGVNIEALYLLRSNSDDHDLAIAVDKPDTALPHIPVRGRASA
ncbi:MAG TPA: amino acid-binding protein [Acidimicrobiia bacterium]